MNSHNTGENIFQRVRNVATEYNISSEQTHNFRQVKKKTTSNFYASKNSLASAASVASSVAREATRNQKQMQQGFLD